jgi:hypothetical protein
MSSALKHHRFRRRCDTAHNGTARCKSARGPEAERRTKILIYRVVKGSILDAYSHPELLQLEITESMVMQNVPRAIKLLDAIQSRGSLVEQICKRSHKLQEQRASPRERCSERMGILSSDSPGTITGLKFNKASRFHSGLMCISNASFVGTGSLQVGRLIVGMTTTELTLRVGFIVMRSPGQNGTIEFHATATICHRELS